MRKLISILLSLCLGLFLADAVISLIDDSLILFAGLYLFTLIRGMVFFATMLVSIVVYVLMGFTPMIPKRLFLPITLFTPVALLVAVPLSIFYYGHLLQIAWGIDLCQVVLGLIIAGLAGGFKSRWLRISDKQLGLPSFGWLNLSIFLLLNIFVLPPAVVLYLVFCTSVAVDHFSEGFLALRPDGLTVQARKYVRDDGRTIQLVPMAHIGDSTFYRTISQSFPTNSIILMEGVTDNRNLLTNEISYKRMAKSLGLSEQQKEFAPPPGQQVRADVDVELFSTNTIDFLNLIMLVHSKGMNPEIMVKLMDFSPPPHFEEQLFDDLLRKRNHHVLEEIQARLQESGNIVVPWGVAHMPEIAEEIQKAGFRLVECREYKVIRFGGRAKGRTTGF